MIRQTLDAAKKRMEKCVEDMQQNLATIRTGRASVSILDHIQANYYGTPTPLNQMASLSTPDPTMIVIQPWDPSTIPSIEKAILTSDLGLNPTNDGKVVRLPIPPLTQERRKQLAKSVGHIAEQHRVAVRQVRHDANDQLKTSTQGQRDFGGRGEGRTEEGAGPDQRVYCQSRCASEEEGGGDSRDLSRNSVPAGACDIAALNLCDAETRYAGDELSTGSALPRARRGCADCPIRGSPGGMFEFIKDAYHLLTDVQGIDPVGRHPAGLHHRICGDGAVCRFFSSRRFAAGHGGNFCRCGPPGSRLLAGLWSASARSPATRWVTGSGARRAQALYRREDSFFFRKQASGARARILREVRRQDDRAGAIRADCAHLRPPVAGAARMNYRRFVSYNVFGGILWVWSMVLIGYFLGSAIPDIDRHIHLVIVGRCLPVHSAGDHRMVPCGSDPSKARERRSAGCADRADRNAVRDRLEAPDRL